MTDTARDCIHGQLARSCEICERDQRIAELEAEVERLRHEVDSTRGLWCIDRDPRDVGIGWIRANAFQLKAQP